MASAVLGKVSPTPKGEYVSTQDYDRLDVVTYEGYPYLAKSNVPSGNLPTDELYWMPLLTDLDFAPGGYGLGADPTYVSDANTCKSNGWFYIDNNTANKPTHINYAVLFVYRRNYAEYVQEVVDVTRGLKAIRHCYDGATWSEWAYENPPIELGVEYRTTERWNGAVVYTKMVDCGALPDKGTKSVTFASEATAAAFAYYGRAVNNGELISIPWLPDISVKTQKNKIYITTTDYFGSWYGYVTVKYTK